MSNITKFLEINTLVCRLKGKLDFYECTVSQLIKFSKLKNIKPTTKIKKETNLLGMEKEKLYRNYQGIFLALMCEDKKKLIKKYKKVEKIETVIELYKKKNIQTLDFFSKVINK